MNNLGEMEIQGQNEETTKEEYQLIKTLKRLFCEPFYTEVAAQVLGKLGPGQSGPGQLGPGQLGPGQLGPGAQLSGA